MKLMLWGNLQLKQIQRTFKEFSKQKIYWKKEKKNLNDIIFFHRQNLQVCEEKQLEIVTLHEQSLI